MTHPISGAPGAHPTLTVSGAVAHIRLNAPERHNALRTVDVDALDAHLAHVDGDPTIRVAVLSGAGDRTFCAGAALDEMESGAMSGARFDHTTGRLAALRVPTIAALAGSVYGGGAELALCCDLRVGAAGIRLRVPAAELGVCYPFGGLERYVHRLGLGVATRVLVAGEELDADEMLRVGYLTHRVAPEEVDATVARLADGIAAGAPLAIQTMKRLLGEIAKGRVDREAAQAEIDACATSADVREGLRAKRERRPPRFEGR